MLIEANFYLAIFEKVEGGVKVTFPDFKEIETFGSNDRVAFFNSIEKISILGEGLKNIDKVKIENIILKEGEYIRYIPFVKNYKKNL
ncbi:hypothetical protein [Cetobacterium sp.]|uniref:hypothetical protein n=1 Tax=Cetobacterium sp. TaxID=2071632 RepID=UPI003F3CB5F3